MSNLSRAHAHLTKAVGELEDAIEEVPAYSVEAVRFLRREVQEAIRRLGNCRKVLGDQNEPDPAA